MEDGFFVSLKYFLYLGEWVKIRRFDVGVFIGTQARSLPFIHHVGTDGG